MTTLEERAIRSTIILRIYKNELAAALFAERARALTSLRDTPPRFGGPVVISRTVCRMRAGSARGAYNAAGRAFRRSSLRLRRGARAAVADSLRAEQLPW